MAKRHVGPTSVRTLKTLDGHDEVYVGGKLVGNLYGESHRFFMEPNSRDWHIGDLVIGHLEKRTLVQRIRLYAKILNQARIDRENGFKVSELDVAAIGEGVTIHVGSDCIPGTIIDRTVRTMVVQEDECVVVSGSVQDGSAKYEINPSILGTVVTFRRGQRSFIPATYYDHDAKSTKDWVWLHDGAWQLTFGRTKYEDPHI